MSDMKLKPDIFHCYKMEIHVNCPVEKGIGIINTNKAWNMFPNIESTIYSL